MGPQEGDPFVQNPTGSEGQPVPSVQCLGQKGPMLSEGLPCANPLMPTLTLEGYYCPHCADDCPESQRGEWFVLKATKWQIWGSNLVFCWNFAQAGVLGFLTRTPYEPGETKSLCL